jgi:hypothetical protein
MGFILIAVINYIQLKAGKQNQIIPPDTQPGLATSAGKRMRGSKQRHSEYKIISNHPRLPARPWLQVYNDASKLPSNLTAYSNSFGRTGLVVYV